MSKQIAFSATPPSVRRIFPLIIMIFSLVLCACGKDTGSADMTSSRQETQRSGATQLAYGISITLPASYTVGRSVGPNDATKATLDQRKQAGERVLLLESVGSASPRGIEPLVGVFLVNQEGTFLPRQYAEKMQPDEFEALGKDMLAREKADAKKKKAPSGLVDMRFSRENVGGKLAIRQKLLVKGPDGNPVQLNYWDIYLPNGAGIAFKSVYDQQQPGMEQEIDSIVRSIQVAQTTGK
jgi:hypothetical protein